MSETTTSHRATSLRATRCPTFLAPGDESDRPAYDPTDQFELVGQLLTFDAERLADRFRCINRHHARAATPSRDTDARVRDRFVRNYLPDSVCSEDIRIALRPDAPAELAMIAAEWIAGLGPDARTCLDCSRPIGAPETIIYALAGRDLTFSFAVVLLEPVLEAFRARAARVELRATSDHHRALRAPGLAALLVVFPHACDETLRLVAHIAIRSARWPSSARERIALPLNERYGNFSRVANAFAAQGFTGTPSELAELTTLVLQRPIPHDTPHS